MTWNLEETIGHKVEQFIRTQFDVAADDPNFNYDINLWEEGYVDSIGVVELIEFLETEFDVHIPERHLFSPDFTNIRGIVKIIQELKRV